MKKKTNYIVKVNDRMNTIVTKLWFIAGSLILASIITISIYFINQQFSNRIDESFSHSNSKIDSNIIMQKDILDGIQNINQKLDKNIDSIGEVNTIVKAVNRSMKKMNRKVDTLIVYIKK